MDPRDMLKAIEEQKKALNNRIQQINGTNITKTEAQEFQLQKLLQRKKILEEQRRQEQKYKEMEKEYNERRQQMEREKQLQRVKNQKRVIQLEAAMKRVVFEGLKEKVKGMNSDQLMMRGFLASEQGVMDVIKPGKQSEGTFKDTFESYLLNDGPSRQKPKYNLNELNQKRLQIFQKKQEVVMKQILLKELAAMQQAVDIDVLAMKRQELVNQLQRRRINIEDYMHTVRKEDIIDNYQQIKEGIERKIQDRRKELQQDQKDNELIDKRRKVLREQVGFLPFKDVQVVKRLLYDLFDQICNDYDRRHISRSKQDQQQRAQKLQQEYQQVLSRNLVEELSHQIIDDMLERIRKEMVRESAEEMFKLHQLAHQRTEDCFKGFVGDGQILTKIQQLNRYKIGLNFVDEDQNQISRPKNQNYMKNVQSSDSNVFQTQTSTTNLVNDIALLDAEQKYLQKVQSMLKNQKQFNNEETIFIYDRQLFAVTRQKIQSPYSNKVFITFNPTLDGLQTVRKMHRNWLLQSDSSIISVSPWHRQELGNAIGSRISNPCGNITFCDYYPVMTLLVNPCSTMLGFQKGQLLKYNFNTNHITSRQTNITHYLPVIEHAKSGDQPAFPLDNRNYIAIEQQKAKPTDQMHEFRQFFQYHSEPIIFVGFYRIDKMISIDRALKCALWEYSKLRGVASFEPVYAFQIRCSYQIFKQDQNPRYKDIYPTNSSTESPQEMYKKYMQTQNFIKMQLYNNPKKEIAYFKAPTWQKEQDDKPIWKITYKDSKTQINKILQSFYNVNDGKITAQLAKLQSQSIYILCEREHVIRNDLKTIKIYSWSIAQRRLGRVGLQIDMYKDQKVSSFQILPNLLKGTQLQLAVVVNSGRILMFSLVSGQLLKNINDEMQPSSKESKYYFKAVVNAMDRQILYAITGGSILELGWEDNNSINERNKLNKAVDNAKRKFFR